MKKMSVFFVLLLTLCFILPVSAQTHIGAIGGLNLGNFSVHPNEDGIFENGLAYGLGGVFDYHLSKSVALYLEPMYLQRADIHWR